MHFTNSNEGVIPFAVVSVNDLDVLNVSIKVVVENGRWDTLFVDPEDPGAESMLCQGENGEDGLRGYLDQAAISAVDEIIDQAYSKIFS